MITVSAMRDRLLSLSTVTRLLKNSEPLSGFSLDEDSNTVVSLNDWNSDYAALVEKADSDITSASIRVSGQEFDLTKEAVLKLAASAGVPKALVLRTPAQVIEPVINYGLSVGATGKKLLVLNGNGVSVSRESINPFSNVSILESVVSAIRARFGDTEILVDYKFSHTLAGTTVRLIVPEANMFMRNTDAPVDNWSMGIQIDNALTGSSQTRISGYLFRWICTNGLTETNHDAGIWSRKTYGQDPQEVYSWAGQVTDEILTGLPSTLRSIQSMVDVEISESVVDVLRDVFDRNNVPARVRDRITNNMVTATDLSMYSVLAAITEAANDEELNPNSVSKILELGGSFVHSATNRCNSCHRAI